MTNWLPFLSYACVTIFTPGPNNLLSATMGGRYGYRKTLPFIWGMFLGLLSIMLACSLGVDTLYTFFPNIETPLRYFGFTYILWLAWKVWRSSQKESDEQKRLCSLKEGLLMQYANPKVILFGITVTASFIAPNVKHPLMFVASSAFLALIGLLATSSWALLGSIFRRYLAHPRAHQAFNSIMALLLLYCAFSLLGLA